MVSGLKMMGPSLSSFGKGLCSDFGAYNFLETRDMKYLVNMRRRKAQFISNKPNILKNLIWPIELWSQVMIPFVFHGVFLVRL